MITSVVDNVRLDGIGGNHVYDVLYDSDNLGRLIKADEGKLSGSSITTHKREEEWVLSHTGNWDTHKLDLNGNLNYSDSGELNVSDTFNTVKELTVRSGNSTTYDAAGSAPRMDNQLSCWSRPGCATSPALVGLRRDFETNNRKEITLKGDMMTAAMA